MPSTARRGWLWVAGAIVGALVVFVEARERPAEIPPGRREVVFWHFWGGKHREVVERIVARFNASQDEHFVRAAAMPGHNLDVKFFLSIAGKDPPDLLNQDDPVVGDWAHRGAILPLSSVADPGEIAQLQEWLFPPARELGTYRGELYALCNGLDIRALYYDKRVLDEHGLAPPRTLEELDRAAVRVAPPEQSGPRRRFGFLPDPRRLWAWGIVFGGEFFDARTGAITVDSEPIVRALEWMASYSGKYGAAQVTAFRKGDQALAGASFPLLEGRYAMIMDGQWRVAEMAAAQQAARRSGRPEPSYGVVPLPPPRGGRANAGWVNGNLFVVPRGARNPGGAWAFMKFWSGFGGNEAHAADACTQGGWIPASPRVVRQPKFQRYLVRYPAFRTFVELAGSPSQRPTPNLPGSASFYDEVVRAAEEAMYLERPPRASLQAAARRIQTRLDEWRPPSAADGSP